MFAIAQITHAIQLTVYPRRITEFPNRGRPIRGLKITPIRITDLTRPCRRSRADRPLGHADACRLSERKRVVSTCISDDACPRPAATPGVGWVRLISPPAIIVIRQLASTTSFLPERLLAAPATVVDAAIESTRYGTLPETISVSMQRTPSPESAVWTANSRQCPSPHADARPGPEFSCPAGRSAWPRRNRGPLPAASAVGPSDTAHRQRRGRRWIGG